MNTVLKTKRQSHDVGQIKVAHQIPRQRNVAHLTIDTTKFKTKE